MLSKNTAKNIYPQMYDIIIGKGRIAISDNCVTGDPTPKVRPPVVSIPRQHKDIAFRSLSATFKDEVLNVFGLNLPKVVDIAQTAIPLIEVKDRNMDINLVLINNTILHIEFESSEPTEDDQIRYGFYDLGLFKQRRQYIHRLIVYGAGIKNVPVPLDIGAIRQSQTFVHLEKDYDGDKIFRQIRYKIEHEILLNGLDKFHIALIPMMKSQVFSKGKMAWELTQTLLKVKVPDTNLGFYLIGVMLGANYSWIEEPYKSQILEVLKMAQPFEDFYETFRQEGKDEGLKEGRDEGLKEGRDEGLKEGRVNDNREAAARILNKKFGLKSLELQGFVKGINNEDILFRIIEEIPFAGNIKAAEKIIETAMVSVL